MKASSMTAGTQPLRDDPHHAGLHRASPTEGLAAMTTSVTCDAPVPGQRACGINAIGRCGRCGDAFCLSHRAVSYGIPFDDQCSTCLSAERNTARQRQRDSVSELDRARERISAAAARLARSGLEPHPRFMVTGSKRRGLLGRRTEPVLEPLEPAWIVGRFKWDQQELWNRGFLDTYDTGVTPSGKIVPIGPAPSYTVRDVQGLHREADVLDIANTIEGLADKAGRG
ncbi:hypothetical protein O7631_30930 [Micromonospora sp. WMMD967]|uniref:hypothetical protein n=1 Tax=Micromonospora sp. WMMD967 TaxID=3016101 RepID=UPI0024167BE6|nr:hypothetical protein [Micromonospora sp. WMMD967]MDG4840962.1 hypothetical protein [Micromonospora sp. WMMD967]